MHTWRMVASALLTLSAPLAVTAQAPPVAPPATPVAPAVPSAYPPPNIVVSPQQQVVVQRQESPPLVVAGKGEVGQQHLLGVDFLFGSDLAARLQLSLLHERDLSGVVEVFGGRFNTAFGEGDGFGFGGRLRFTVLSDGDNDALVLAPGLDLRFFRDQDTWLSDRNRFYLTTDVDIAWLHDFSYRLGWELGLKAGVGVGIAGDKNWHGDSIGGDLTGVFSFYTGLRF